MKKEAGIQMEVIFDAMEVQKICDKLGFEPSDYDPPVSDTKDDTHENPFVKLTSEEITYLYKNGYLSQ